MTGFKAEHMGTSWSRDNGNWRTAFDEAMKAYPGNRTDDKIIMSRRAFSIRGWLNFAIGALIVGIVWWVKR